MSMAPRMLMAQRQSLVMTPQLQQAIKLLQLNQMELAAFIEAELEQNPLLVRAEDEPGDRTDGAEENASDLPAAPVVAASEEADETAEPFDPRSDVGGVSPAGDTAHEAGRDGNFSGDDEFDPVQSMGETLSLRQHLLRQIGIEFADPAERLIAICLTDMLDGAGYLTGDMAALVQQLGMELAQGEAVLRRLQRLEPAGLYARNLAECLALQLAERNRLDPAMQALLDNLELVAKRDLNALMRRCGVDAEDLADMVAELRRLDPKPGHRFDAPPAQPIVPDIFLRPAGGGGWTIELNTDVLPRVLVNRQYYATLAKLPRDNAQGKATREFISERVQTANWLVKALDQRANTILRVAREVVRQQDGFFRRGVTGLKPLVLRDIAVEVELHESTISRVTANKYISTPRGIFELKYFFTSAVSAQSSGSAVTSEAVRDRIRLLIEGEPALQPLSDDRLVSLLQGEGVVIARRTVAKYRDTLGIASSAQRRRDKALVFFSAHRTMPARGLRSGSETLSAE